MVVKQWTQTEDVGNDDEAAFGTFDALYFGRGSGGKSDPHVAILSPPTNNAINVRVAAANTITAAKKRNNMVRSESGTLTGGLTGVA
jgi:hypothetical protein